VSDFPDWSAQTRRELGHGLDFLTWCRCTSNRGANVSKYRASRANWPKTLDMRVADTNEPVVQVHGRITVPGHQSDLVSQLERPLIARDLEPPMLIRRDDVGNVIIPDDPRHA
jgi:hypothetical protein